MRSTACKIACAVMLPFALLADWRQDMDDLCWKPTATAGTPQWVNIPLPFKMANQGVASFNGYAYMFGGSSDTVGWSTTNVYWNGSSWVAAASLPVGTYHCPGTVLSNKLWMAGGVINSGSPYVKTVYYFDGNTWTQSSDMPAVRFQHGFVTYGDYAYIPGGQVNASTTTKQVLRFNGAGTWDTVADMPAARRFYSLCVHNNYMWVIGGYTTVPVNTVYRFDGTSWTTMNNLAFTHYVGAAYDLNGTMYLAGGLVNGTITTNAVWAYNDANDSWSAVEYLPFATRSVMSGEAPVVNGVPYIIGGYNDAYLSNACQRVTQ